MIFSAKKVSPVIIDSRKWLINSFLLIAKKHSKSMQYIKNMICSLWACMF